MKLSRLLLLSLVLSLFAPDAQAQRRRSNSMTEAFEREAQRHPALRLAEEGKFAEAWKHVERGEDTKGFYERGVQYYNYWSVRTARRTPSGKPDPSMADTLNDINEDNIRASEVLVRQYEAEAAKGNPEAQAWLDKYRPRVRVLRGAQDVVSEGVRRDGERQQQERSGRVRCTIVGVSSGDVLNIRSGPGTNYPAVCTVENGHSEVYITGPVSMNGDTDWYPVAVGNHKGWARGKHLQRQ